MIEDMPEPEYMQFDTLSVLELNEDEACNTSALSSQFEFASSHEHGTPKRSIATHTTQTGGAKVKASYSNPPDDFDYNSYIREELQKLRAEDLDPHTRKRLIQKIRNRMSAQRSRNRSKAVMGQLQDENAYLRLHNTELIHKLQLLKEENSLLREQLASSPRTEHALSEDAAEERVQVTRRTRAETVTLYKNVLVISAIVLAMTMAPGDAPESVKLGGVVPLLTTDPSRSVKQLQSMESICKSFCLRTHGCDRDEDDAVSRQVRLLADLTREVQLYTGPNNRDRLVPLACSDEKNEHVKHIFLFKRSSLNTVKREKDMLYAPELVIVKPELGFVNN